MKVVPAETSNRVIIKRNPTEQKFGSLIIPETVAEKPLYGVVVAVSDYYNCPKQGKVEPTVKVGDEVLFENHKFVMVDVQGEEHVMIREYDIIMTL